jgi:hypothetical protein
MEGTITNKTMEATTSKEIKKKKMTDEQPDNTLVAAKKSATEESTTDEYDTTGNPYATKATKASKDAVWYTNKKLKKGEKRNYKRYIDTSPSDSKSNETFPPLVKAKKVTTVPRRVYVSREKPQETKKKKTTDQKKKGKDGWFTGKWYDANEWW